MVRSPVSGTDSKLEWLLLNYAPEVRKSMADTLLARYSLVKFTLKNSNRNASLWMPLISIDYTVDCHNLNESFQKIIDDLMERAKAEIRNQLE